MRVFGERTTSVAPRHLLREITATLRTAEQAAAGPERHDLLTRAFIDAAALAQGVADAEFEASGHDDISAAQDAAMALTLMLARKLTVSAWSGFDAAGPGVSPQLIELATLQLPERLSIRTASGFAFHGVLPEAYLKAAAEHPWPANPMVVGLRIGGGGALAALVAVATGARKMLTIRPPQGLPQDLPVSGQAQALIAAHEGPIAVVGELRLDPAELAESLGVNQDRVVILSSGAGGEAPSRTCAVASFERLAVETSPKDWFADLTGPVTRMDDLSAGAWRTHGRYGDTQPAFPAYERRKFRLHTASGAWLARFAGLGAYGEAKLDRARALHRAGFTPEPLALRRGFLLERWEDAGPPAPLPRERLVAQLGAYLGFRAMAFPAEAGEGAERAVLAEMAQANVRETLEPAAVSALTRALSRLITAPEGQRVHVDARLHPWEWLHTPDDLILKVDALDHSAAEDIVGAQEIAWDIAGAQLEFELSATEAAQIRDAVHAATGERTHPGALLFNEICYAAFQAGYWRMAEAAAPAEERPRLAAQANLYVRQLGRLAYAAESSD